MAGELTIRGAAADPPAPDSFAELYGEETGYRVHVEVRGAGAAVVLNQAVLNQAVPNQDVPNQDVPNHNVNETSDGDIVEIERPDGVVEFLRAGTLAEMAHGRDLELSGLLERINRDDVGQVTAVRRISIALPPEIADAVELVDTAVGEATQAPGSRGREDGFGALAGLSPGAVFTPAARAAMKKVADWIDAPVAEDAPDHVRRRRPKVPGVYRLDGRIRLDPGNRLDGTERSSNDPYLLMMHGTFSHTEGTFGSLRDSSQWAQISGHYSNRVLALEHPTLGLTPTENALAAARLVPAGSRLHLLGHSRGGLVGEVFSYAARHQPALAAYQHASDHPDLAALPELHRVLTERGIAVERFARVACPARGTTLASRRLDSYASYLFNVFRLIPTLRETGVAELVKKFLLTLLEQRTDPRIVPGIEAMMPESPFVLMLTGAAPLDDGLGNITGDVQGDGLIRRLAVAGADLFYRADHDFVVNTDAMSGGVPRNAGRTAFFQGTQVHHGSYFVEQDSRDALAGWLTSATLDNVAGFREAAPPPRGRPAGREAAAARHGRVLLLPDVFGSTLRLGGAPSWPDVDRLITLSVRQALAPDAGEDAPELTPSYAPLIDALAAGFDVDPVPYDPRHSLAMVGAAVARTLRARLDAAGLVHVVTHGAGALVALAARRAAPQTWEAMIRDGGRVVLLSPPLAGSWLAAAHCSGRDELTAALALLEPGAEPADVGKTLAGWKALAELIPDDPAAIEFRRGLLPRTWSGVTAIYGSADRTVCGRSGDGFSTTTAGDGHVTFAAARVSGLPTWYALVPHADLPGDAAVIQATTDLLGGHPPTSRVFTTPGGDEPQESPLADPRGRQLMPTSAELVRMAWGGGRARTTDSEVLQVSVMHGDLRYVGAPVLVGTYDGTPLKGADSVLDRHLGGAMGRRAGLGQHPGRAGTCEVFRRGTEPAAVVIGLGDAGDITPGRLAAGVTTGVSRLVLELLDSGGAGTFSRLQVAAVLIGTGGVAPLTASASVTAIVSGVRRANRRLADLAHPVTVDRLVLVELYEERAIEAIHAAAELPGVLGSDGSEIRVDRHILDGRNGLPGEPSPMYSQGAWTTVRVVAANASERAGGAGGATDEGRLVELSFTSVGRAARAEQRVSTGQRELLDLLVARTIDRPDADPQLWNTLYELLVPTSLKRQGHHGENLMYVVDEHAAALPLEMLATRSHDQSPRPLGVEVGIVRRLETRTFREVGRAATGHHALVIGDPPAAGLARLPEAAREARRVVDVLTGHGYQVTAVIGDENTTGELAVDILNALFAAEYRIVHIAGHGNVSLDPTRSGVVIGTDTYLTALEIEKMMTTPDLVFLNCCHLAALRPRRPAPEGRRLETVPPYRPDRLAAGISRQLVDNGVRAVVAAGWAVDDLAAADFAEIFYDQLLRGSDLGEASLTARREVFDIHQDRRINTWGAYQVYGPPAFRIAEPTAAHHAERDPMARRELRDHLNALRRRAEAGDDPDVAAQLDRLLAAVPAEWLGAAELCAAGGVWTALGQYQRAVEALDGARAARDGDGSERAVVQLVTVLATWAAELSSAVQNDSATISDTPATANLFADAERYARALIALGPTPERWSLLAGVERRRAQCADPAELAGALERARDHYGAADTLARSTGRIDCGAALNHVVLDWIIAQREDRTTFDPGAAAALIADCLDSVRGLRCPDFWARIVPAEAALVTALIEDSLPASMPEIAAEYERAFADDSGRRERLALLEHLAVRERGLRWQRGKRLAAAADALRELRSRLDTWNG